MIPMVLDGSESNLSTLDATFAITTRARGMAFTNGTK